MLRERTGSIELGGKEESILIDARSAHFWTLLLSGWRDFLRRMELSGSNEG